jgi:hypothetical protein
MIKHGTKAGYHRHRKLGEEACAECKRGAAIAEAKRHVDRARYGPALVPAAPIADALDKALAAGIPLLAVTRRAGIQHSHAWRALNSKQTWFHRETARKLDEALRSIISERRAAMDECLDHLEFARSGPGRGQGRMWPTGPLREAMDRRWPMDERNDNGRGAPPISASDRRYLNRFAAMDEPRAERLCRELGFFPETVWPEWFDMKDAG